MLKHLAAMRAIAALLSSAAEAEEPPERINLVTFAQRALPVLADVGGQNLRTVLNHVLAAIVGNPVRLDATARSGEDSISDNI